MTNGQLREKLALALEAMKAKAMEMGIEGVAAASVLNSSNTVDWIGEMKVVGKYLDHEGGFNLVAVAWSKCAEVMATLADSGNPNHQVMTGELNYTGGAYDEHEQHANSVRSVGDVTLFSTEYLSVWRSKRFRVPMLILTVLFLLEAYMMPSNETGHVLLYLYFLIAWPSMFLGQWVFGIEGNYFHGLWTKPYSIEHLLLNKYKFFILLTLGMAVLLIPAIFFMGMRPTTLLALILFLGCGQSLLMMPTCLFSTRVDLFTSSFFNYQGASMRVTVYSFIIIIPLAIYVFCTLALPPLWGDAVMAAIGLAALAIHRPCIRLLAQKWKNNRYDNMERYLK